MASTQPHEQPGDNPSSDRETRFVLGVIQQCGHDKGLAARLRRADNPATEYQSWDVFASYGIDLTSDAQRLPFATMAAAIARAKAQHNGNLSLGRAMAACYEDGQKSDQAKMRLRRVLACDELPELCRVLRPVFSLVDSKVGQSLDYVRLLKQLRRFAFNTQRVKAQWAQEFYGQQVLADSEAAP
jgi:CRISPR system Cascade subunit CasB